MSETPKGTTQSFPHGKRKKDLGQNQGSATVKMHHVPGMGQISTGWSIPVTENLCVLSLGWD